MSISNGFVVVASDLQGMASTALGLVQADNAALPLGHEVNFTFVNVVAGTTAPRSKSVFVVPYDCWIETLAIATNDCTNASTVTVSMSCPGVLDAFPVSVSTTVTSGAFKMTRILYDNTRSNSIAALMVSNPALRLLPKGSTVTLQTSTTSVATPSSIQVVLVLRSNWNRG